MRLLEKTVLDHLLFFCLILNQNVGNKKTAKRNKAGDKDVKGKKTVIFPVVRHGDKTRCDLQDNAKNGNITRHTVSGINNGNENRDAEAAEGRRKNIMNGSQTET